MLKYLLFLVGAPTLIVGVVLTIEPQGNEYLQAPLLYSGVFVLALAYIIHEFEQIRRGLSER